MASSILLINLSPIETQDISEEDPAEPVQARLLMVCFFVCCWFILLDTLLFVSATASVRF